MSAGSVLALQRLAGNRAVASLAAPSVQRRIGALGHVAADAHSEVVRKSDGKRLFVVDVVRGRGGWRYGLGTGPGGPASVHADENDDGFDLLDAESAHRWKEEQLGPVLSPAEQDDLRRRLDELATPSAGLGKLAAELPKVSGLWAKATISKADKEAIDDWVAGGWSALNRFTRGLVTPGEEAEIDTASQQHRRLDTSVHPPAWVVDPKPILRARLKSLGNALLRLARHEGSSYRHAGYKSFDVYGRKIVAGDYLMDRGFTASSLVRGGGGGAGGRAGWAEGAEVFYEIRGASGRRLADVSSMSKELEVLFLPGTLFRVDAIRVSGPTVFVLMHEVGPGRHPAGIAVKDPFSGERVS